MKGRSIMADKDPGKTAQLYRMVMSDHLCPYGLTQCGYHAPDSETSYQPVIAMGLWMPLRVYLL